MPAQILYRASVSQITDDGVYCIVPSLGTDMEFGPLENPSIVLEPETNILVGQVEDFSEDLVIICRLDEEYEPEVGAVAWNDVTSKPTTFPPSAHAHSQADITGLVAALSTLTSDISNLTTSVAGKAPTVHSHAQADVTGLSTTLAGLAVPSGTICQDAGSTPPTGWLLCDGQAVSRTTYAALFARISTTYGVGNGTTTFNLPNLKGKVAVGRDSAQTEFDVLGETGGAKTVTLTIAQMPAHHHRQALGGSITNTNIIAGGAVVGQSNDQDTLDTGGGLPHENLQPYLVLNYIIKI